MWEEEEGDYGDVLLHYRHRAKTLGVRGAKSTPSQAVVFAVKDRANMHLFSNSTKAKLRVAPSFCVLPVKSDIQGNEIDEAIDVKIFAPKYLTDPH